MTQPFTYKNKLITYSVGQPMGAYSSWAMLALTHHVIVQSCSTTPTLKYAILGDDVVVSDALQQEYLTRMKILGVNISLPKSLISTRFIEFAKKTIDIKNLDDYSPLGAGLIMACIRFKVFSPNLISLVYSKQLITLPDVLNLLKSKFSDFNFGLFSLFGAKGLISRDHNAALSSGVM
jgi:hypothetical protein